MLKKFINDILYAIRCKINNWKLNRIESQYRTIQEDYTGSTQVEFKIMDNVEYIINVEKLPRSPMHPVCRNRVQLKTNHG